MPHQRQALSLQALSKQVPIKHIARTHNVSRKFVYRQQDKGKAALDKAFSPVSRDGNVLFFLPVTPALLKQVVLCLALVCHSSIRGIKEFIKTIFDMDLCVGTVHDMIHDAVPEARRINASYSLSSIKAVALDELFQGERPEHRHRTQLADFLHGGGNWLYRSGHLRSEAGQEHQGHRC